MNYRSQISRSCVLFSLILYSGFLASVFGQPASGTSFAQSDIEKLRWIEGKWRGTGSDRGKPFYEQYNFTNDGRIETRSYGSDATFGKVENSGWIYLDKGEIIHKGGEWIWVASRTGDGFIEFAPRVKATNFFAWKKESTDIWIASIASRNSQGKMVETVYKMERIK